MQDSLRFVFEQKDGTRRIRDRAGDRTWQLPNLAPDGKTPEDYAIVSRVVSAGTGQALISAAGITQYGTRSAGEFLTTPALLTPPPLLARPAPRFAQNDPFSLCAKLPPPPPPPPLRE